ncbi:MAG: acyl dehydratase [Acidimicrobiales bacterium]
MTAPEPSGRVERPIAVGDTLTPLEIDVTATLVAAGAIATRDFMPVHHDRDYANVQGAPDIFMNILSDTGYCSRFLTDWAGPDAMVRHLAIRLGVPVFPGTMLRYTGEVTGVSVEGDEVVVEIGFRATTPLGDHVTGSARLTLPVDAPAGSDHEPAAGIR